MNKRRKLTGPELLLLLVPAFALVGWAAWLQGCGPSKPFKLTIDDIKVVSLPLAQVPVSLSPPEPNMRGVQVTVFIGHEGPAPSWWGQGVNCEFPRVNFTTKGEKDDGYTNIGDYSGVNFDQWRSQYTFVYKGKIPNAPHFLKQASCHISAAFETQLQPPKKLASAMASISGQRLEQ